MKKRYGVLLTAGLVLGLLAGCSGGEKSASEAPADAAQGSTGQENAAQENTSGERQVVEFWFHAADENSSALYEEIMEDFNRSQDKYEARYTGFANKDFPDKFTMAIATQTMPDVVSLGFSNVMTYVAQDALIDINDYFNEWEDSSKITPSLVETLRGIGNGKLYGVPYNYNQDISWYNTKFFEENNVEVPTTQKEFLKLCEEYADPDGGTYF